MHWKRGCYVVLLLLLLSSVASAQIEIVHMRYAGHGAVWDAYIRDRAEQFQTLYPDTTISFVIAPGPKQMIEAALIMHATGSPLDVMEFNSRDGGPLISNDIFLDLRPWLDQDAAIDLDDFIPGALQTSTAADGRIWSFPIDVYTMGLTLYWTDMFAQAGVAPPRQQGDNWTWENSLNAAQQLTMRNENGTVQRWGAAQPARWWEQGSAVLQAGGWFFDDARVPTASTLLTPEVQQGLEHIMAFVEREAIGGDWYKRTAAMDWTHGPGFWNAAADDVQGLWDVWLAPHGPDNNAGAMAVNGFQISAATAHPERTYEWVKFLAGSEGTIQFALNTSRLPALRPLMADYRQNTSLTPQQVEVIIQAAVNPLTKSTNDLQTGYAADIRTLLTDGFQPVTTKTVALESWLQTTHQRMEAILRGNAP